MTVEGYAEAISHQEFRAGLPAGQFRLVVNPKLARRYVSQRLMLVVFVLPVIGFGIALVLMRATLPGALFVAAGVLLHRGVQWQATRILLHMALRDPAVYAHVTQDGILEVQRAA